MQKSDFGCAALQGIKTFLSSPVKPEKRGKRRRKELKICVRSQILTPPDCNPVYGVPFSVRFESGKSRKISISDAWEVPLN